MSVRSYNIQLNEAPHLQELVFGVQTSTLFPDIVQHLHELPELRVCHLLYNRYMHLDQNFRATLPPTITSFTICGFFQILSKFILDQFVSRCANARKVTINDQLLPAGLIFNRLRRLRHLEVGVD